MASPVSEERNLSRSPRYAVPRGTTDLRRVVRDPRSAQHSAPEPLERLGTYRARNYGALVPAATRCLDASAVRRGWGDYRAQNDATLTPFVCAVRGDHAAPDSDVPWTTCPVGSSRQRYRSPDGPKKRPVPTALVPRTGVSSLFASRSASRRRPPPRSRSSRRPGSAWNHPAPTRAGRPAHGSGAAGHVPPTIDVRRSVNTSVDGSAVSGSIATSEAWRLGDFSGVRWSVGTPAARPLVRRSGPRRRLASERHKSSGRTWPRRAERGHSGGKRGLRRFTSSEPRPRHQAPTSPPSTGCGRSTTGASRQERCDWHSLEHDSSPPRSILRTHWRA